MNVPDGHAVQKGEPGGANVPEEQATQVEFVPAASVRDAVPAGHARHASADVEAVLELNVPDAQFVHVCDAAREYVPWEQSVQAAALLEEEVPGEHFWQASAEFEPVTGLNVPDAQSLQADAPSKANFPTAQFSHFEGSVAPAEGEAVPAEQSTQLEELEAAVDVL